METAGKSTKMAIYSPFKIKAAFGIAGISSTRREVELRRDC